ncbi:MAG: nitrate/nitrite transporter NrtS, partial [Dehalococcoidia bacterium]
EPTWPLCRRHFVASRAIFRRALLTSAIVGSTLLAINQGDALLAGHLPAALWWKVPLTYLVPYLVSTSGALAGARLTADEQQPPTDR